MGTFYSFHQRFFKVFFLIFLWLWQGSFSLVSSQTFAFKHYTEKEGLPSTYLYGILQDKEGHIWLAGESGLLWYNGHSYQVPDIQNDFKDEIIKFFDNDTDQLWMQDLAGRILVYKDKKIQNFPEINPKLIYDFTTLYKDSDNKVLIANTEDVFLYNPSLDSLIPFHVDNSDRNLISVKVFGQTKSKQTLLVTSLGYHVFEKGNNSYHPFKNKDFLKDFKFGIYKEEKICIVKDNKIFYLDLEKEQLVPQFEKFNSYFQSQIINLFQDKDSDLWVTTKDGLLLIHKNEMGEFEISKHLEGEVMGGVMEDRENNLWFVTDQNGFFQLSSKSVKIFNHDGLDKQTRFVRKNEKGELILGFDNNEFKVLNESFEIVYGENLFDQNNRLYDLAADENGDHYFITSRGLVRFDENFKRIERINRWSLKSGAFGPNGKLWLASGHHFGYLNKDKKSAEVLLKERCYSLLPLANGDVWVGSIQGPFLCKNGKCTKINKPELNHDIRDIKQLGKDKLLFATQKNGLYYYQPSTDSILFHFSTSNGLSNNNCSKILVDEDFIWLCTKQGVNQINRSDFSISIIGIDQGLPSNEINDIYQSEGLIYVATNRGVATFDKKINLKRMPPLLEINSIKISERDTTFHEIYDLDYFQNNIKIEFEAITFNDANHCVYQYKMDGIDNDWVESKINLSQYPALNPGNYTFHVKTKTLNSDWSEEKSIQFKIKRPFWKNNWFYLFLALLGLCFTVLILTEVQRRRSRAKDLKASRLTALRAQMNPHFLFNALNSIQEFIVDKDTRSANKYLAQFSRLMRNILNVSDKDQITLSKEIESLQFYLNLEALRLGDSFKYILEIEPGLDKSSLYLPPMLLQPFVENAIKHGLMHLEGEKKLYLRFFIKERFLVCEIEDNGIGRERSAEIRKLNPKVYPSKATGLTNDRINLYNSISNNFLSVNIIDLLDDKKNPTGTKVSVFIHSNFKVS